MIESVVLPSGKIVNAKWQPTKSEFIAVMVVMKPYRDLIPSKATELMEEDYKHLKSTYKKNPDKQASLDKE